MNAWSLLPWKTNGTVHGLDIPLLDSRAVVPVGPDPYADRGYSMPPSVVFLRPIDNEWPDVDVFAEGAQS
jgi:hypothetical protein